jgi:anti-sigma-K factor RskA
MAELGSAVPMLLASVEPVEPPSTLKGFILSAAAADTQRERMPAAADRLQAADTQRERMPAADTQRDTQRSGGVLANLFRRPIWAGIAMAAVIAAVALGVGYLNLRTEADGLVAYRNGVAAVLEAADAPGAQLAVMRTPDGGFGPGGFAAVSANGTVTLVMHDLDTTQGTQVYEAWLIAGDNAPVPIGGFTVSSTGTASFVTGHPALGQGVTVALTLEPGPNATTPTLPIVAAGAAGSAS